MSEGNTREKAYQQNVDSLMKDKPFREKGICKATAESYVSVFDYFIDHSRDVSERTVDGFRHLLQDLYLSANADGACQACKDRFGRE